MTRFFNLLFFVAAFLAAENCTHSNGQNPKNEPAKPADAVLAPISGTFNDYWYQGKAELSTYEVEQERYGEMRRAEQVNIFVTEDFSRQKQVKLDDPASVGTDRLPILKLNTIRRFHTGIYDYSLMQSVFAPVDGSPAVKIATSIQDWCGQVFMQTNLDKNGYRLRGFSYFEMEGDQDVRLPLVLLEDALWARLRLNPTDIPTGKLSVVPSAFYVRLRHKTAQVQPAELQIDKGDKENTLRLVYTAIPRTLTIRFETAFPHRILGWEETDNGNISSKGKLKSSLRSPYWMQHDNASHSLRDSLRLLF